MAHTGLLEGVARPCLVRSAALAGYRGPCEAPASPADPALDPTALALLIRWRGGRCHGEGRCRGEGRRGRRGVWGARRRRRGHGRCGGDGCACGGGGGSHFIVLHCIVVFCIVLYGTTRYDTAHSNSGALIDGAGGGRGRRGNHSAAADAAAAAAQRTL